MNAPLSAEQRKSLFRAIGAGVPLEDVAAEYGISVSSAQIIDRIERRRSRLNDRVAEPLPALRDMDWKSARPAAECYLPSDGCKWPIGDPREQDFGFCGTSRLKGHPYCGEHCRLAYPRFEAEAV